MPPSLSPNRPTPQRDRSWFRWSSLRDERGAVGLATLIVLSAVIVTMSLVLVATVDALATANRGQHGADILAIAAMEASPLAGGAGQVNRPHLDRLARRHGVILDQVDTTGWPLRVRVTIRAEPDGLLQSVWSGVHHSSTAEVVPPTPTGNGN